MAEVDPVTLRLFVENGQAVAALNRYARTSEQSFGVVQRGAVALERTMGGLAGVLSGVSAVALAQSFLQIADTAKTLDAQLRLATSGFGTFAQAQEDVRRIAATTRSGLEETASLYGNFARGAKELGADQDAAARATETFSKTLKISGADTNQAASATLQFGQALAAGALRGDELNSILEASPRLARLLAESFGMPIGKIKELGEEGKLTSDKLLNALTNTKFTAGIDREFAELPVTFQDAMTQVENAAIITFGAFDRGGQFSTALASFVMDGSNGFADLESSAVEAGIGIRAAIEGLVGSFDPIFDEARRFFEFLNGGAAKVDIGRDIDKSLGQIDTLTDWLANKSYLGQKLNGTRFDVDGSDFQGRYRRDRDAADLRLRRQNGLTPVSRTLSRLSQGAKDAAQTSIPRAAGGSSDADKKKAAAAARKAASEARKAEQERLRAIRDDASKARDAAQLQDDITAARAALAVANEDILAFNLTQIESERQQRIADYETRRKLGQVGEKELADRIAAVNEIADLQRQRVEQIAAENQRQDDLSRLQASVQDNSDLLRAQADLVASREQRRDIELRLLDLAYEQERAELEAVIASGTATAAQKEIAEQRLRILDQLKGYQVERVNRDSESPLEQRRREVRETAANMGDAIENIEIDAVDRLADGLANASKEYIKLGGVAGDVINGIIADLVKLAVKQAIFGGLGGGGGFLGIKIPGFAKGTNYAPGGLALVGEEGPEVVDLPRGSRVVPNNVLNARAAASMVGATAAGSMPRLIQPIVHQTVHVDARNSVNPTGFAQQLLAVTGQQANQAAASMGQNIMKAVPGRLATFQRDGT